MKLIGRFEAWQLFVLFMIPPMFSSNDIAGRIIICLWFSLITGWVFNIGILMYYYIPEALRPDIRYFKINMVFIFISIIVILGIIGGYSINQDNYKQFGNYIYLIIPFHLYFLWSLIYLYYFSAKMLASVIEGEIVSFNKYYGAFFAFWFFPIGVWYAQPIVRKIVLRYS